MLIRCVSSRVFPSRPRTPFPYHLFVGSSVCDFWFCSRVPDVSHAAPLVSRKKKCYSFPRSRPRTSLMCTLLVFCGVALGKVPFRTSRPCRRTGRQTVRCPHAAHAQALAAIRSIAQPVHWTPTLEDTCRRRRLFDFDFVTRSGGRSEDEQRGDSVRRHKLRTTR